jgi:protoporphyrinogen/coproporphyrinogen III oxidase
VVGAGPAGLSAAWSLAEAGASVVVYERAPVAGGLLRTELLDGARVDVGVQLVGSPHTSLFELARRVGAQSLLKRSPGHDALWRRGRPHGITYGSVASMVASGALPTTLKLKLASRYIPFLKLHARRLDVNDPAGRRSADLEGETIGAWGRRELGDDFVELLVYPILAAYYGAAPEETAAGVYHALAKVGLDVSVYGAAGGFGALAAAAASALEARGVHIVTGREVGAVRPRPDAAGVLVDDESFDAAVVAVPATSAARLLAARDELGDWLGAVVERATVTVAYRLNRPFPGDYFGLSFPRTVKHGTGIAAVCIQSRKLPGLVPPGGDALVVLPAPHGLPDLLPLADGEIAALLLADLERAVPGVTARVTLSRVFRFDEAYTLFDPAHMRRLRSFDAGWLPARVALAGDYLMAPSVEGAVRSGALAARAVVESGNGSGSGNGNGIGSGSGRAR